MDTWTKIRLLEWTFWPSLWRKLQGKKGKIEKHLEPSIYSRDIFFPLPREKTSIRSLSDIRRRVLQKIYCYFNKKPILILTISIRAFYKRICLFFNCILPRRCNTWQPTETNFLGQDLDYSRTSIKRAPLKRPTFIWRPRAKVTERLLGLHCNKILCSTATSITQPRPASCSPKGGFVLFYTSIKWPGPGCLKAG